MKKDYKIAVAGTGYVGLSIATLLSSNIRWLLWISSRRRWTWINNRKSPIQDDYIEKYLAEKELNLTATLDAKVTYSDVDFVVIAAPTNVYLKLSVAAWWSTVAYKTHAKYPYCEPVLLQSKVRTWYLHFSEELEVEVESVEKPKIYFSGKVYCRQEMDMIPAFSGELEVVRGRWLFVLQQKRDMNLYSFNKVSWY